MPFTPILYDLAATLHKWPGTPVRTGDVVRPDQVYDGTLGGCIREFMAKPASQRPLYEVFTEPQAAFSKTILSASDMLEIATRDDFPKS